jgi:hypothetical protein
VVANNTHTVNGIHQLVKLVQCFPQVKNLQINWKVFSPPYPIPPTDPRIAIARPVQGLDQLTQLDIRMAHKYVKPNWAELDVILAQLRLPNVKNLSIYLHDVFFCDEMAQKDFVQVQRVLSHIPYNALEHFSLTLEYNVHGLPGSCPWVSQVFPGFAIYDLY